MRNSLENGFSNSTDDLGTLRFSESRISDLPEGVIDSSAMHDFHSTFSADGPTLAPALDHHASASVILATSPKDEQASALMRQLDAEIAALYPGSVISGIDGIESENAGGYFVILRHGNQSIGCGGFRPVDDYVCGQNAAIAPERAWNR
jgi:hypothetical protein